MCRVSVDALGQVEDEADGANHVGGADVGLADIVGADAQGKPAVERLFKSASNGGGESRGPGLGRIPQHERHEP